jgi:ABC-type uncharacterized transport system ATPase subunit
MGRPLDKVSISGFKSIRTLKDFELKKLNIVVGANGAGKTTFATGFLPKYAGCFEFVNTDMIAGGEDEE